MRLRSYRFGKGVAAALVIGVAVVGLSAQQSARGGAANGRIGMGPGAAGLRLHAAMRGMFLRGVRALDLTAEQQTQIRTAMTAHREESRAIGRECSTSP